MTRTMDILFWWDPPAAGVRLTCLVLFCIFLNNYFEDFIYLFLKRGKGGRKRERETSVCYRYINRLPLTCHQLGTWPTTQACALTGNQTGIFQFATCSSVHLTTPARAGFICPLVPHSDRGLLSLLAFGVCLLISKTTLNLSKPSYHLTFHFCTYFM